MAIRLRSDHPFIQDFKRRRDLEALDLTVRLDEAKTRHAAMLKREANQRAKLKRMATAKVSEQRKCAAVILERRKRNAKTRARFPSRAAMLDEIKTRHPDLADITVRSQPFEKAWKANAPKAARDPGKKPRA